MRLLLLLLFPTTLHAQIYADFTVRQGGTPLGTFTITLEHEKAPRTCANFIGLATGRRPWVDVKSGAVRTDTPFYDGLSFHRLDHDYVLQGGSPDGSGGDGPGYLILDEFEPSLVHSPDFVISMAKTAPPNTAGSQFFITLGPSSFLDFKHAVFGKVTSGQSILQAFRNPENFPTGSGERPTIPIIMESVVIHGPDAGSFDINDPSLRLPEVRGTVFTPSLNPTTREFIQRFDRSPKTEYLFLESTDLTSWTRVTNFISLDGFPGFQLNFGAQTSPRYFVNAATVNYDKSPDAPVDVVTTGKTVRIFQADGTMLDLNLTPGAATWSHLDAEEVTLDGGLLSNVIWVDEAPTSGFATTPTNWAYLIPLGTLSLVFDGAAGPDDLTSLNAYLSFHTETSGWIQERSGLITRYAFEILSN